MSQKDGAKVVIIFDSTNTFAKKMLRKVLLSVFLEVFIDVFNVI